MRRTGDEPIATFLTHTQAMGLGYSTQRACVAHVHVRFFGVLMYPFGSTRNVFTYSIYHRIFELFSQGMRTKRLHEDCELVAGVVDASLAPGVPGVAPHVTKDVP